MYQLIFGILSPLELTGALLGFIFVALEIRQCWIMFFFSGASSLLYVVVFFYNSLYFSMFLHIIFLGLSIHGLYLWKYKLEKHGKFWVDTIKQPRVKFYAIGLTLLLSVLLGFIVKGYGDIKYPYLDSTLMMFNILGSLAVNYKKIETWYIWMTANALGCILYFVVGLYPTAILYILYFVMSVRGYMVWAKILKQQNSDSHQKLTLG